MNASNTNLPDSNANAAICPQLNELSPSSADSLSGTGRHPLQNDVNSNRLTGIRRYLAIAGAFLCLTLALLGVVIPGLPTTPFVLLASGLFLRSSPGLHRMLRRNRIFGRVIDDWECRRAVRRHVKVLALAIVEHVTGFFSSHLSWWNFQPIIATAEDAVAGTMALKFPS